MDDLHQHLRGETSRVDGAAGTTSTSLKPGKHRDAGGPTTVAYNPLMAKRLPVYVRMADELDAPFIYSSWLQSYANQNQDQHRGILLKEERKVVTRLLEESVTVIACMNDDTKQVFAWMTGLRTKNNRLVLHYCYTKQAFRSFGLAKLLLTFYEHRPGEAVWCSHRTFIFRDLRDKFNLFYIPQLQQPGAIKKVESGEWQL